MERPQDSCAEILDRLTYMLPAVFHAFGISEARAQAIVEDACLTLASKRRLRLQNPEGWLLRTIIDACRRSAEEEERVEDPSA
jgi:DNA-directed RNA polymerase specialized sigma24 family protein